MKLLITGGLGQVGSSIADRLSGQYDITVLDNYSNNFSGANLADNIRIIKGDIRNLDTVKEASKGVDFIIHTAAQIDVEKSTGDPLFDADNNIIGTLNLLKVARGLGGLQRFVYFSSAAVYGIPKHLPIDENHPAEPISPYGLSKLTGERYSLLYHKLYGLPVVCVRPFNIYSERQNPENPYSGVISKFIEQVKEDKPPIVYGAGDQTRDFVHVSDVISFVELALETDNLVGEVFNIGTGEVTSIKELANVVLKLFAKENLGVKYGPEREGDIKHSYADIGKARGVGYAARVSLTDGLRGVIR